MINKTETALVKNGFQIIRNAIPQKLIKRIQRCALESINSKLKEICMKAFYQN